MHTALYTERFKTLTRTTATKLMWWFGRKGIKLGHSNKSEVAFKKMNNFEHILQITVGHCYKIPHSGYRWQDSGRSAGNSLQTFSKCQFKNSFAFEEPMIWEARVWHSLYKLKDKLPKKNNYRRCNGLCNKQEDLDFIMENLGGQTE